LLLSARNKGAESDPAAFIELTIVLTLSGRAARVASELIHSSTVEDQLA